MRNMKTLKCEWVISFKNKSIGLMHREQLPDGDGMLFAFRHNWFRHFWMKNMQFPLDIIFIDDDCNITKIVEAPMHKGLIHKKYNGFGRYVIECNQGFCSKNNFSAGDMVTLGNEIMDDGVSKLEINFLKVAHVDLDRAEKKRKKKVKHNWKKYERNKFKNKG